MSYVQSTLSRGEIVRYRGKIHWAICILPAIIAFVVLPQTFKIENSASNIISAIVIYWIAVPIIHIMTTEIAVTNRKIVLKQGIFTKNTIEQQLNKVDFVQVKQGILGGIIGYGTIIVNGSGMSATPIKGVAHPLVFRKHVQSAIDDFTENNSSKGRRRAVEYDDDEEIFDDERASTGRVSGAVRARIEDKRT